MTILLIFFASGVCEFLEIKVGSTPSTSSPTGRGRQRRQGPLLDIEGSTIILFDSVQGMPVETCHSFFPEADIMTMDRLMVRMWASRDVRCLG